MRVGPCVGSHQAQQWDWRLGEQSPHSLCCLGLKVGAWGGCPSVRVCGEWGVTTGWTLALLEGLAEQHKASVSSPCATGQLAVRVCVPGHSSLSSAVTPSSRLLVWATSSQAGSQTPVCSLELSREEGAAKTPRLGRETGAGGAGLAFPLPGQHRKSTEEAQGLPGCSGETVTGETAAPSSRGQGWREPARQQIPCNSCALHQMMGPEGRRRRRQMRSRGTLCLSGFAPSS